MQYQKSFGMEDHRTPLQCRTGPLQQRKCTDILCCILYLLLIGVIIAFGILSLNALKIPTSQIEIELKKSQLGNPLIGLSKSFFSICLALACVAALCFLMVILSFIIPQLVAYIFIPVSMLLALLLGSGFIYIYIGKTLPFLSPERQAKFIDSHSWLTLGCGILLLTAFLIIIFVIVTKKQKFRNIVSILKFSKSWFWQNCYMIFVSMFLTVVSIVIWYLNIYFLEISQDRKDSQHLIDSRIMSAIILVEILWTHGFMEGIADFVFQSETIIWYFNKAKYGEDYNKCRNNCFSTFRLVFHHIGTIVFGAINAYIPEEINSFMKRLEQSCTTCYKIFCCCHRFTIRKLSKYGYSETILQSLNFYEANLQMYELKRRAKLTLPELYMQGNYFTTICKILILMLSLLIVYILLIQQDSVFYYQSILNLIAPLLVTLFASSEICNHFMNGTGLVGDTIVFMYTVDLQIQKKNFGKTQPHSCPEKVRDIIRESRINEDIDPQL